MSPELVIDARLSAGAFRIEVQLELDRGPLVLVGPNGAGKTTLLRALAGGAVWVDGRIQVRGRTWVEGALCLPPEQRRVGYLPQGFSLFPHRSVLDNVAFGIAGPDSRAGAQACLAALGAAHLAQRRPRHLSGGEQQRVALARALARQPELLLLDEPTASLDVTLRRETRELLADQLHAADRLAVAVTHDLRDLLAWKPTIGLLDQGRVAAVGDLGSLRKIDHPFLRELLEPVAL